MIIIIIGHGTQRWIVKADVRKRAGIEVSDISSMFTPKKAKKSTPAATAGGLKSTVAGIYIPASSSTTTVASIGTSSSTIVASTPSSSSSTTTGASIGTAVSVASTGEVNDIAINQNEKIDSLSDALSVQ
jgi:hypothetical protein